MQQLKPMGEKEMIEGCRRKDQRAMKNLYDTYSHKMMAVLYRYTSDRERAKDLLHDGFVTVFTKIKSYRGDGSFEGWLRRVFVTTALIDIRKKTPLEKSVEIDNVYNLDNENTGILEKISAKELIEEITKLPQGYRTIFNMYGVEGYSHKEIAEELGIAEATSRSQYMRAKSVLVENLKNHMK